MNRMVAINIRKESVFLYAKLNECIKVIFLIMVDILDSKLFTLMVTLILNLSILDFLITFARKWWKYIKKLCRQVMLMQFFGRLVFIK